MTAERPASDGGNEVSEQRALTQAIRAAWDTPPFTTEGMDKPGVALMAGVAARVALAHRDEQLRELKAAVRGFEADAKLARSAGLGVSGTLAFTVVAAARRLLMEETK